MTDGFDAGVLAQLAEAVRPALRPLRDADTQNLNELTIRRNQLMTMLVAEKNRPRRGTGAVHPRIKAQSTGWKRSSKTWTKVSGSHCFAIRKLRYVSDGAAQRQRVLDSRRRPRGSNVPG